MLLMMPRRACLAHSPLPQAIGCFRVQWIADLVEDDADLAAMIKLVRDQVAHEGDGVRLEPLDLAPGSHPPPQQRFNRRAGRLEGLSQENLVGGRSFSTFSSPPSRSAAPLLSHISRTLWMCMNICPTLRPFGPGDIASASTEMASSI